MIVSVDYHLTVQGDQATVCVGNKGFLGEGKRISGALEDDKLMLAASTTLPWYRHPGMTMT